MERPKTLKEKILQSKKDEADAENADDETRRILHGHLSEEEPEKPTMTLRHIAKASAIKLTLLKQFIHLFNIQSPTLLLPYLDNFMCFTGNGMIEAMLEPHLKREAGATQFDVAMTFLILGGCYMLTTPIWGYVSPTVPLNCSTFNFDQFSWTHNSLIIIV